MTTSERLRDALAALRVNVLGVSCRSGAVALDGYPGGTRPTTLVTLHGDGQSGAGEYVGWTTASHAAFAAAAAGVPRGRHWMLSDWCALMRRAVGDPYARAALEAAAVALATQQARTTLPALAQQPLCTPRVVRSLAPGADPWTALAPVQQEELKLDVDLGWTDAVWDALAARYRVAVLDFKSAGTAATAARAHRAFPNALLEDPAAEAIVALAPWISLDATITSVAALETLRPTGAVNLKVPRLGGVFETLAAVAWCERQGLPMYLGGMWEVGPGRHLSHVLAGLFSPEGPNDIAPLIAERAVHVA